MLPFFRTKKEKGGFFISRLKKLRIVLTLVFIVSVIGVCQVRDRMKVEPVKVSLDSTLSVGSVEESTVEVSQEKSIESESVVEVVEEKVPEAQIPSREEMKESVSSTTYNPSRGIGSRGEMFVATAYTSHELGGSRRTATGTQVTQGRTIAVDPRYIPYKSKIFLYCPSYPQVNGIYTAEDCGGAIKSRRLDIYFENYQEALRFGVREVFARVEKH